MSAQSWPLHLLVDKGLLMAMCPRRLRLGLVSWSTLHVCAESSCHGPRVPGIADGSRQLPPGSNASGPRLRNTTPQLCGAVTGQSEARVRSTSS
jgi:hypothetical protein